MTRKYLLSLSILLHSVSTSAQTAVPPPIIVGVTLNESGQSTVYRGWPLLARAAFLNENAYQENVPVKLSSNWKSVFRFTIRNSVGNIVSWPFHLADSPNDDITLDSSTVAELGYWMDADETNLISAGEYALIGILDSTAYPELGSNFSSAETDTHAIKIMDEPVSLSIEQRAEKDLLFANLNILKGDDNNALVYLNGILGYNPNNLRAILLTGKLLEDQGDYGSSLYAYTRAVDIFFTENPDPPEPPFELLQAQNDLAYKLDNALAFNITFAAKDTTHPFYNLGSPSCYYVDNIPARELQLKRGNTYTFFMKNIPSGNPFYLSTNIEGGSLELYSEGVTGAPADSNEIVTFSVSLDAPDTLYYQSYGNTYAGWRINVSDTSGITSVNDDPHIPREYSISLAYPNPFNPQTNIKIMVHQQQHILIRVFNITGEQVQILFDGNIPANESKNFEFNGANLASGIYLIRVEGSSFRDTRKVILLK